MRATLSGSSDAVQIDAQSVVGIATNSGRITNMILVKVCLPGKHRVAAFEIAKQAGTGHRGTLAGFGMSVPISIDNGPGRSVTVTPDGIMTGATSRVS